MKAKIKDIADIAGVSTGTVDRVIHNRGRVAGKTKAKVLEAMKRLDYKPDIMARTLARKEDTVLSILTPYPYQDFYWKMVRDGIEKAVTEYAPYRLLAKTSFYDMDDTRHFYHKATQILDESPDVLLIGSEYYRETIKVVSECAERSIPCIVMNAEISSVQPLTYIGIHSFAAGTLAGRIISTTRDTHSVLVVHNTENLKNTLHLKNKELGMVDVLQNSGSIFIAYQLVLTGNTNKDKSISKLGNFIKKNNIDTVYFTASHAYRYAPAIKNRFPEVFILAHDLIQQNVTAMKNGFIDLIIDQNGYKMGYNSVKAWIDHHLLEKNISKKQYLPLDIIYPENLPYTELMYK